MGHFRIEIVAVGGHGCNRTAKAGDTWYPCGRRSCPDCEAVQFVEELRRRGSSVVRAVLTHWPSDLVGEGMPSYSEENEVRDDIAASPPKRVKGSF